MIKYIKPEIEMIYLDINSNTMDGYVDGDVDKNPWDDLFTEQTSPVDPV